MGLFNFFAKAPVEPVQMLNRKLFTILTDLHEGSPYLKTGVIIPRDKGSIEKYNVWMLGDIKERKNCAAGDLFSINKDYALLKNLYGDRYIDGNHEVNGSNSSRYTIAEGHICMAHGDYILWGDKKANEFRNNKAGGDSGFIQKMLAKKHGSISNSEAKELANYARSLRCDVIVIGHVHPKVTFDQVVGGVRVICCPRGRTELFI